MMTDIHFMKPGVDYKLCFKVVVSSAEAKFDDLEQTSAAFTIIERLFYLTIDQQPIASAGAVMSKQPHIAVRVVGDGRLAYPLTKQFYVTVNMTSTATSANGVAVMEGTKNISVSGVHANFTDLLIRDSYGPGFVLEFTSNFDHVVSTPSFDVAFKNDYYPVFNSSITTLFSYENETVNTVFHDFDASDSDTGLSGQVRYYVTSTPNTTCFKIDSNGVLSLNATLDRELHDSYDIRVVASDKAPIPYNKEAVINLKVTVGDVNDNAPLWNCTSDKLEVNIPETATAGTAATNCPVGDLDLNTVLSYRVVSEDDSDDRFRMEVNNGKIMVQYSLDLDNVTSA